MNLDQAARYWRSRLDEDKPVYRVRVRRLLEFADAERRGANISNRIRETLAAYGLRTEPDFQSVWPGSLVQIVRRVEIFANDSLDISTPDIEIDHETDASPLTESEVAGIMQAFDIPIDENQQEPNLASQQSTSENRGTLNSPEPGLGVIEVKIEESTDPVARISGITSSKLGVQSVRLSDPISTAMTTMIFEGYSQLAILHGEREVRGIVSWESIAKRSLIAPPVTVADCRVDAQVIDADGSLLDALPTIEKFGYVLVRSADRKITGIVTASDLSAELGRIAYAFMSLRTIEVLVRKKLHPSLSQFDLEALEEYSKARIEMNASELTFGENVRLMERPEIWERLSLQIDKAEFLKRLTEIRDIRNDVMHFDPDPLTEEQKTCLKQMENFLSQVFV